LGNNPPTKENSTGNPRFHHTNDRSYAVLLSKQRHRHASLLIGDGVVENRDRSTTPLNYRLRCFEPDLALFPQQQMFNGGPDKSGSGRKPRVKDEGDTVVDLLIKTETHNTILDH
jgi:hypothetical protein